MPEKEKINWSKDKKTTLSCTYLLAPRDAESRIALWTSKFPGDLERLGSRGEIARRLQAQWGERTKKAWSDIAISRADMALYHPDLLEELQTALRDIRGRLLLSPADNTLTSSHPDMILTSPTTAHTAMMTAVSEHDEPFNNSSWTPPSPAPTPPRRRTKAEHHAIWLDFQTRDHGLFPVIGADRAHPPAPSILFRFYDAMARHVVNDACGEGFVAGWFETLKESFSWKLDAVKDNEKIYQALWKHVNGVKKPSFFVSTSRDFFWSFLQACKASKAGLSIRLAIIDGDAAAGPGGQRLFSPLPYYKEFLARKSYLPGKWMHAGSYELLIFGGIPSSAIISDLPIEAYQTFFGDTSDASVPFTFQPDVFYSGRSTKKIRLLLRDTTTALDENSVTSICRLLVFMLGSDRNHLGLGDATIAHLVSDIVSGWVLRPTKALTTTEWRGLAEHFVDILERLTSTRMTCRRALGEAFLYGAYAGFAEVHWQNNDRGKRSMAKKAQQYGLGDPSSIYDKHESTIINVIRQSIRPTRAAMETQQPIAPSTLAMRQRLHSLIRPKEPELEQAQESGFDFGIFDMDSDDDDDGEEDGDDEDVNIYVSADDVVMDNSVSRTVSRGHAAGECGSLWLMVDSDDSDDEYA